MIIETKTIDTRLSNIFPGDILCAQDTSPINYSLAEYLNRARKNAPVYLPVNIYGVVVGTLERDYHFNDGTPEEPKEFNLPLFLKGNALVCLAINGDLRRLDSFFSDKEKPIRVVGNCEYDSCELVDLRKRELAFPNGFENIPNFFCQSPYLPSTEDLETIRAKFPSHYHPVPTEPTKSDIAFAEMMKHTGQNRTRRIMPNSQSLAWETYEGAHGHPRDMNVALSLLKEQGPADLLKLLDRRD